jgi:hypothetical protein
MEDIDAQLNSLNSLSRAILRGLLQKDPTARPASLADFKAGMQALKLKDVREYFNAAPSTRLELLKARYQICTNCAHTADNFDDMEAMNFLPFLEIVLRYEEDAAVKSEIISIQNDLDGTLRSIVELMKQENPE